MAEWLQVALLAVLIIILYVISSRWRPEGEGRVVRVNFWVRLALILLILALLILAWLKRG